MKKIIISFSQILFLFVVALVISTTKVKADLAPSCPNSTHWGGAGCVADQSQGIINPAIDPSLGGNSTDAASGSILGKYIILIWRAIIIIGALAMLLNFVTGAFHWILAAGDQGKITKAREQMTQSVIGMVILAFSFTIIGYALGLFNIHVFVLTIPTPGG